MGKIGSNLPGAVAFAFIAAGAVTTPSQAQTAAGESPSSARLEEVVVTAGKGTEDVQNVGLSMPVLGAEQLESKGVSQFWDYGNAIPNLSFATGAADGSLASRGIAIRGIEGANTTGFYIDDTPVLET